MRGPGCPGHRRSRCDQTSRPARARRRSSSPCTSRWTVSCGARGEKRREPAAGHPASAETGRHHRDHEDRDQYADPGEPPVSRPRSRSWPRLVGDDGRPVGPDSGISHHRSNGTGRSPRPTRLPTSRRSAPVVRKQVTSTAGSIRRRSASSSGFTATVSAPPAVGSSRPTKSVAS
jgi:hypothetical protein